MNKKIKLVSAVLFLLTTNLIAGEFPASMQGSWQLHVDESMELLKKSPKFKESETAMMTEHLNKMVGKMIITVSKSSVAMAMGQLKQDIPVKIVSAKADEAVTNFEVKGKQYDLTLKVLKGKYLQLISSATDDMNSFAWEKR